MMRALYHAPDGAGTRLPRVLYFDGEDCGMKTLTDMIDGSWRRALADEFGKAYFARLASFVDAAYAGGAVYPPRERIFEAFSRTPFEKVRAVILGQDPYHEPGQAHGLAFSVREGVRTPPSLANVYRELEAEYGAPFLGRGGDLSRWADQGVLLLNATLTVAAGEAGSHHGRGWETFTDAAVARLSSTREHLVFLLWGGHARRKGSLIDRHRHLVLEAPHPSPLSAHRGFLGCGHFRKANEYLSAHGTTPISW